MTAERMLLTFESPSGSRLISLPKDAALADLLPGIVEACEAGTEPEGWSMVPRGEPALDVNRSLGESGLYSGAVIDLIPPPAVSRPAAAPVLPRIDSMGEADYRRFLEQAIQGSRLTSNVVAVVGAQPGAGATTVTALLATLFAALRSEPVAAVDANPQTGALSHWLVPDGALSASAYRALLDPAVSPLDVEGALAPAAARLAVLPAPLDAGHTGVGAQAWSRVIGHLRRLRHLVIVDCGSGTRRPEVRALVASADNVVFVSRAELPMSPPKQWAKPVVVVGNQSHRRARMRRPPGTAAQITVALDDSGASLLKRRGFDWRSAPPAWQEAVRELASLLVASG